MFRPVTLNTFIFLFGLNSTRKEPVHKILILMAYESSEGSDEPAHLGRLIRAFATCTHNKDQAP